MYAIIATGGKQYKVSKGDKVRVEKLEVEVGSTVTFDKVLLVSSDKVTVGSPCIEGACVEGEVTAQGKERKVIVYKYKPKTGYHKKNGHRQMFTEVVINKIFLDGAELEDAEAEEAVVEEAPAEEVVAEEAPAEEVVAEEAVAEEAPAEEAVAEEAPAEEAVAEEAPAEEAVAEEAVAEEAAENE